MRRLISGIGLLLFGLGANLSAQGGENTWVALGPTGGDVWRIIVDPIAPATLYVDTLLSHKSR